MANLAPDVLKRRTCGREALGVSLYDLCFLAGEAWEEQMKRSTQKKHSSAEANRLIAKRWPLKSADYPEICPIGCVQRPR